MQFTSYAKNCIDVLLWRAFKDVTDGYCVNVDVNPTDKRSISKAFCQLGWHCVYIPSDALNAIEIGSIDSSSGKPDNNASKQRIASWYTHLPLGRPVNFMCLRDTRSLPIFHQICCLDNLPWVLLIGGDLESPDPKSGEDLQNLANNYELVYSDSAHQIYLCKDHEHLKELLTTPPNIFDDFKFGVDPNTDLHQKEHNRTIKSYLLHAEKVRQATLLNNAFAQKLQNDLALANAERKALRRELEAIYMSASWRMTSPIRFLLGSFRVNMLDKLRCSHWLRSALVRLRRNTADQISNETSVNVQGPFNNADCVSARTQEIYGDLIDSIPTKDKD